MFVLLYFGKIQNCSVPAIALLLLAPRILTFYKFQLRNTIGCCFLFFPVRKFLIIDSCFDSTHARSLNCFCNVIPFTLPSPRAYYEITRKSIRDKQTNSFDRRRCCPANRFRIFSLDNTHCKRVYIAPVIRRIHYVSPHHRWSLLPKALIFDWKMIANQAPRD